MKVLSKNNVIFNVGQTVDSSKPLNLLIISVDIRLGWRLLSITEHAIFIASVDP